MEILHSASPAETERPAETLEDLIAKGNRLIERNDPDAAAPVVERLFQSAPDDLRIRLQMALLSLQQNKARRAIPLLEEIYRILPDISIANNLVVAYRNQNRYIDALPILEAALREAPDNAVLMRHAVYCYTAINRNDRALFYANALIRLIPDDGEINILYGITLTDFAPLEQCEPFIIRALTIDPDNLLLLRMAIGFYERHLLLDRVIALSEKLLAQTPDDLTLRRNLLQHRLCASDWRSYDELVNNVRGELQDAMAEGQELPYGIFNLQTMPFSYREIAEAARYESRRIANSVTVNTPTHATPALPKRRIRLGYILPYTHFHSLPLVLVEVVKRHDPAEFETFGYCIQPCLGKPFSKRYRRAFHNFTDVPRDEPETAADIIRRDDLDILIDVSGHTPVPTMDIMASRPAPVQMHGFGYSITTGADFIDYIITDRTYINTTDAALGSESPIYLPDCFLPGIKGPRMTRTVSRASTDLPPTGTVFVNFNDTYKFTPDSFDAWMQILQQVPGSVFWMIRWWQTSVDNIKSYAADKFNIAPERIVASYTKKHAHHLRRLQHADIALDNFRHGGGITTLDYFRAGVPLVTLEGNSPSARLGATMSRAIGVDDLITRSREDYIATAVALAQDNNRRQSLRQRLLGADETTPLYNIDRFVKNLECGLTLAHRRYRQGAPVQEINISRPQL